MKREWCVIFFFFFGTTVLYSVVDFPFQTRTGITFLKTIMISKTIFGNIKHSHNKAWDKQLKYVEKFLSSLEI